MRPPLVAIFGVAGLFKAGSRRGERKGLGTGEKRGVRENEEGKESETGEESDGNGRESCTYRGVFAC